MHYFEPIHLEFEVAKDDKRVFVTRVLYEAFD